MGITKTGVINDLHLLPNTPRPMVDLVLDAFEDVGIDRLIINGDLLDFININLHGPKHPDVISTLEDEIIEGREFLEELRARFPDIHIVFLFGNHEDRLDRFILKHAKPFWHICRLEAMVFLRC
jgi:UDP-2,3-diacylglucosamine pyrophosphatase LpxH